MNRFALLVTVVLMCPGCFTARAYDALVDEPDTKKLALEPGKEIVAITSVSIANVRGYPELIVATRHEDGTTGVFGAPTFQLDASTDRPSRAMSMTTLPATEVPILFVKELKRFAGRDADFWRDLEVSTDLNGAHTRRATEDELARAAFVSIHRCCGHEWRIVLNVPEGQRQVRAGIPQIDAREDRPILVDGRALDTSRRSRDEQSSREKIFFALLPFTVLADVATFPAQAVVGGAYVLVHDLFAW